MFNRLSDTLTETVTAVRLMFLQLFVLQGPLVPARGRSRRGAGLVEYAMLALLAAIAFGLLYNRLGKFIDDIWIRISGVFNTN